MTERTYALILLTCYLGALLALTSAFVGPVELLDRLGEMVVAIEP